MARDLAIVSHVRLFSFFFRLYRVFYFATLFHWFGWINCVSVFFFVGFVSFVGIIFTVLRFRFVTNVSVVVLRLCCMNPNEIYNDYDSTTTTTSSILLCGLVSKNFGGYLWNKTIRKKQKSYENQKSKRMWKFFRV